MKAQTYFRLCLFVPLLVPLPFYLAGAGGGLSTLLIGSLVFGMPPYVLFILLPMLYLFGRMSERQIVVGIIFFPIVFPLLFGLFWLVARYFIETVTISFSDPSEWIFIAVVIPAFYSMIFLSGNVLRKLLQGEMGILEQRMAPVLCADFKGNTKSFNNYLTSFDEIINKHRGQQTNQAGDNIVIEFGSVLNAVQCGLSLQQKLKEINRGRPDEEVMQLGIGINLGEVKSKGNAIHGQGVSVALHLEDMSQGGEICISGDVYDRIKRKLIFNYEYMGEKTFEAIDVPVRIYCLKMDTSEPRGETKDTEVKLTLPDKPSIAVLPFDNMSADPEQEYFSDGISEDILTDLSKLSGLFVISRNSSFMYKGKSVNVRQVSQELGVRYILEGSVRKAGNRIRITAQLIDAINDDHLWADRYDRELDDIFAVQDEVSRKIVDALKLNLTDLEEQRLGHMGTDKVEACDYLMKGREIFYIFTPESVQRSIEFFDKAIELDPNYAEAYAYKAWSLIYPFTGGINLNKEETIVPALEAAQKAVALDDLSSIGHYSLAWVLQWSREIEQAISESKRAVELDPNNADTLTRHSMIMSSAARGQEALESIEKAVRLNPYHNNTVYMLTYGLAFFSLGQYEKALDCFNKGIDINPNFFANYIFKTSVLGLLNRIEEAKLSTEQLIKIIPEYDKFRESYFNDKQLTENMVEGLVKAGVEYSDQGQWNF